MRTMAKRLNFITFSCFVASIVMPATSFACGTCAEAQFWALFPPLVIWQHIGVVWFLTLATLKTIFGSKVWGIPNLFTAIVLILAAYLFSTVSVGPLAILPFLLLSGIGWIDLAKSATAPTQMKRISHIFAGIALVFVFGTVLSEIVQPTARKPVDRIIARPYTPVASEAFADLQKEEPHSIPDYRRIIIEGRGSAIGRAASRLAIMGDPVVDVPSLIQALQSDRLDRIDGDLRLALEKMSGMELSREATAEEWRIAWERKMNGSPHSQPSSASQKGRV